MSLLWRIGLIGCLLAVAVSGIDWGLPRDDTHVYLFPGGRPWSGAKLATFDTDRRSDALGADVDRDAMPAGSGPVVVNENDAARAQIIRRYKLYSHQPDEMISFMALQQMDPAARKFDPHLYQYGGLWIYPVGALLKLSAACGFIELRSDKTFYYDHPEAFGEFYVVARAYTMLALVLTMVLGAMIVHRLTQDALASAVAGVVVGALPVVFAMAHDAKPHLGGAALMLAACLAAARWVRTNAVRDALLTGAMVGLATGMVLSAGVIGVVPIAMICLPKLKLSDRVGALLLSVAAAGFTYAATNPYVVLHIVNRDPVLFSNAANTQAMYRMGDAIAMIADGSRRMIEAMSLPMIPLVVISAVVVIARKQKLSPLAILLTVPSVLVLIVFILLAADKPAEYARFALFPCITLSILCLWAITTISRPWVRRVTLVLLPIGLFFAGTMPYVHAFAADTGDMDTRRVAAGVLQIAAPPRSGTLQVFADPAPYSLPPINFFETRVILTRPTDPLTGDLIIHAIDDPDTLPLPPRGYARQIIGADDRPAPITWANKPFEILVKKSD